MQKAMRWRGSTVILAGLLTGSAMFAQQPVAASQQVNPSQADQVQVRGPHDSALTKQFHKRFDRMKKRYKLTAEQQHQLKSILWKEQQDMQTVNADTLMSSGNKREELANLHEASQQKIGSILNQKQKRKFDSDEKTRAWMDGCLPEPNPGPPLGLN